MSAESVSSQARAATEVPAASSPQARSINLLYAPRRGREARVWVGPWGARSGVLQSSRGHPEKLEGESGGGRVSAPRSVRDPEPLGKRPPNWAPGAVYPRASCG